MAAAVEATELCRELAGINPGLFVPAVAGSLIKLSDVAARLERWEDAVVSDLEAAQIFERLAGAAPEVFGLRLALALVDLARNLFMAGDDDTAMDAALRAQQVCRRLPATEPDRLDLEPRLADALSDIGHRFAGSGQLNQAVRALSAVVEIFQRLSAAFAGDFDQPLAAALANLGGVLCAAGRPRR